MYLKEENGNVFFAFITSHSEADKIEHALESEDIPYSKETLNRFGRAYYVQNKDLKRAIELMDQYEMEILKCKANKMKEEINSEHQQKSDKKRKTMVLRISVVAAGLLVLMRLVGLY